MHRDAALHRGRRDAGCCWGWGAAAEWGLILNVLLESEGHDGKKEGDTCDLGWTSVFLDEFDRVELFRVDKQWLACDSNPLWE